MTGGLDPPKKKSGAKRFCLRNYRHFFKKGIPGGWVRTKLSSSVLLQQTSATISCCQV